MDKLKIQGIRCYGRHGVASEENRLGQRFEVSLVLGLDCAQAGHSDDIAHAVNYASVIEAVVKIVEGKPRKLIESVAESIAETVLANFPLVNDVAVTVVKPNPPVPYNFDGVSVEIFRARL